MSEALKEDEQPSSNSKRNRLALSLRAQREFSPRTGRREELRQIEMPRCAWNDSGEREADVGTGLNS